MTNFTTMSEPTKVTEITVPDLFRRVPFQNKFDDGDAILTIDNKIHRLQRNESYLALFKSTGEENPSYFALKSTNNLDIGVNESFSGESVISYQPRHNGQFFTSILYSSPCTLQHVHNYVYDLHVNENTIFRGLSMVAADLYQETLDDDRSLTAWGADHKQNSFALLPTYNSVVNVTAPAFNGLMKTAVTSLFRTGHFFTNKGDHDSVPSEYLFIPNLPLGPISNASVNYTRLQEADPASDLWIYHTERGTVSASGSNEKSKVPQVKFEVDKDSLVKFTFDNETLGTVENLELANGGIFVPTDLESDKQRSPLPPSTLLLLHNGKYTLLGQGSKADHGTEYCTVQEYKEQDPQKCTDSDSDWEFCV